MNTSAPPPSLSPRHFLGLIAAALVSLTAGAIAGTFSLTGAVLSSTIIGLGAMVAVSMKNGNTTTSSVVYLAVSVGIICAPFGAIVIALVLR